jgi:hypothetical protein
MAKIFSGIANGASNLKKRYEDSRVNSELQTFIALRENINSAPTILITKRPEKVYEAYTDPRNITAPSVQTYQESLLITPVEVVRVRRNGFYEGFTIVNSGQTTTNVAENETLIEIKPYSRENADQTYAVDTSKMLRNDQALPIVSGPRDIARMRNYFRTSQGINFKLFQQVLQAGNTFGQSQGYNPVSVETMVNNYSNATLFNPLERVSRILPSAAITDVDLQGRLQVETVLSRQSKLRLKFVGGAKPQSTTIPILAALNNALRSSLSTRINAVNVNLFGIRFNVGQVSRQLDQISNTADAIRRGLNTNNSTLTRDQTAYDSLYLNNLWPMMKENDGTIRNLQGPRGEKQEYISRARAAIKKAKNINDVNKFTQPYPEDDFRSSATYTDDIRGGGAGSPKYSGLVGASYVKDVFNLTSDGKRITSPTQLTDNISDSDKDYVLFKISVPTVYDKGIRFRAFIEDFNHSSKGEYDSVRYIGRPERFITYRGLTRSATLSILLVAFSEEELYGVWTRCNMLNKLVYPIGADGGFMTPPLAKLTLGSVLVDQPGFVENVEMRFQEVPWDIDAELPMAVKLNMTYSIIEKEFVTQKNGMLFEVDIAQRNAVDPALGFNPNVPDLDIPIPNLDDILTRSLNTPQDFSSKPVTPLIDQRTQAQIQQANQAFRRSSDIIDLQSREG